MLTGGIETVEEEKTEDLEATLQANMKDAYGSLSPAHQLSGRTNQTSERSSAQRRSSGNQRSEPKSLEVNPDELEVVAVLYDSIRAMHKKIDPTRDQLLARDFDAHLKKVMESLSSSVRSEQPVALKNATILRAKFDLFDICLNKVTDYLCLKDPQCGNIMNQIYTGLHDVFTNVVDITESTARVSAMGADDVRRELEKSQKETAEVLDAAEQLER